MALASPNNITRTIDAVRADLLAAQWPPGGKLQPGVLAARYDSSTTVIREALTRLAGDGLVVVIPNRGFFVSELDLRELRDITELRCITEELAVSLSLERGGLEWESDLMAAHYGLVRTPRRAAGDLVHINGEWAAAHRAFHTKLLEACACPHMTRLAANLADHTELYRCWAAPSDAASVRDVEKEHLDILEAALARDAVLTASLLRAHYQATVDVILRAGLVQGAASPSRG
ncbi:hypothetical protein BLJ79_16615 [Arthrobacter sp. UCD-GKA]|uniref:GntR family transcriptional regulator n=1 Tax=Arthrobacter sp. UCD-GKA TaxID=1913576 RepID=UPI0008DDD280|nr:GntR family transcriptional regulator [Arthrobacter sp. UCD-GKA]OIH83210.1 hypothetical protein BLJ79_16615 [Arthrobacter sp. UCD-GKA]